MNQTKKITRTLALGMAAALLAGCSAGNGMAGSMAISDESAQQDKMKIVATIFPEYDWTKQILGDQAENADVTLLLDSGVDLHS